MTEVRELLLRPVRLMVDSPDDVFISEERRDRSIVFLLGVAQDDIGKLIGRQGRTVRALRSLLAARRGPGGERYELEILEN